MNFLKGFDLNRFCLLTGIGLSVATLMGFAGRLFWFFDLFSHFRVQVFQIALVFIFMAIWRRKSRQIALFAAIAVINYAPVLPLYFGKTPAPDAPTARAMLMNILASNGNTEQVLDAVAKADPDILVLEEVTTHWAEELEALNESYPHRVDASRRDCFGIMLLSKVPLSRTNVVYVGSAEVPTITARVHLPQGEVDLIATHPPPPFGPVYSKHRNSQLAALPELVAEQDGPILLIGDLNVTPWCPYFRRLLKESGLKNSMQGFGFQPSWPADVGFLKIPLDHMLHSPDITVHHRIVGANVGSDHLPVIVDFSLN